MGKIEQIAMKKKLFLLGVGAQKGGTTWLHNQLSRNDNVDLGFVKEYHVFDAVFSQECIGFRTEIINKVFAKKENGSLGCNNSNNSASTKILSFIDNTENYFDYFDYLYLRNKKIELVGDITPSYSMLDRNAFSHIKSGLESRGFDVKVVFLMRDPLERIWSMIRMERRIKKEKNLEINANEEENLRHSYLLPHVKLRTTYNRTITELESVFEKENIYYGFYENLFSQEEFFSLQKFLDIGLKQPDFDFKTNVSPKNESVSYGLQKAIVNEYRAVYEELSKKSNGLTKKIWNGYDYLN